MTSLVSRVFHFVRGAVRGLNGWEDFSNINFLIIGTEGIGREVAAWISSAPEASVYFTNEKTSSLREYQAALQDNPTLMYLQEGDCIDVVIDTVRQEVRIRNKRVPFGDLAEDAYTQGIHEFYL